MKEAPLVVSQAQGQGGWRPKAPFVWHPRGRPLDEATGTEASWVCGAIELYFPCAWPSNAELQTAQAGQDSCTNQHFLLTVVITASLGCDIP